MQEIELKLQIPPAARAAVEAGLRIPGASRQPPRQRLQARYFDTPERTLASAGIALRLRREGRYWVQTLKASGAHAMERLEHNVTLPPLAGDPPLLNLALHEGGPAGARLAQALGRSTLLATPPAGAAPTGAATGDGLVEWFATDILRRTRQLRTRGGTVELAFDEGQISAGGRHWPVCELEIELVSGQPRAVIDTARRWVTRHGLWLDTATKAHRGNLLALGLVPRPLKAAPPQWVPAAGAAAAWCQLHGWLFDVLVGNAGILAAPYWPVPPSDTERAETLRLLRVGLRRLRASWRLFEPFGLAPDAELLGRVRHLFGALGAIRDRDVLDSLLPQLQADGAPAADAAAGAADSSSQALLRSPEVNTLWLDLLEMAVCAPAPAPAPDNPPQPDDTPPQWPQAAISQLRKWHRRSLRDIAQFETLPDEAVHDLRKRLKRLRYGIDTLMSLLPPKPTAGYLKVLAGAQDALGAYTDLLMAREAMQARVTPGAHGRHGAPGNEDAALAWFTLGWVGARLPGARAQSHKAVQALCKAPRFWRR